MESIKLDATVYPEAAPVLEPILESIRKYSIRSHFPRGKVYSEKIDCLVMDEVVDAHASSVNTEMRLDKTEF